MSNELTSYSAVLGVVLTSLRQERGMEQGDMAAEMGLSQASYSRLESGKSSFSVDQMYQAAYALGVSGEDLGERLNNTIANLQANDVIVAPQVRGNTTQAKQGGSNVGSFMAGAGLAALLIGLLAKK
jgi:transcriptional regulator with XRE-family HTH domain